jgi:hypothetical protein
LGLSKVEGELLLEELSKIDIRNGSLGSSKNAVLFVRLWRKCCNKTLDTLAQRLRTTAAAAASLSEIGIYFASRQTNIALPYLVSRKRD